MGRNRWRTRISSALVATIGALAGAADASTAILPMTAPTTIDSPDIDGDTDDDEFVVWVVGRDDGGVAKPPGTLECSDWEPIAASIEFPEPMWVEVDGVVYRLYGRICEPVYQEVWVPDVPPGDLAEILRDQFAGRVPAPVFQISPPADLQVVNLATWLSVAKPGELIGTIGIPGTTVRVTAAPVAIIWRPDIERRLQPPGTPETVLRCDVWADPEQTEPRFDTSCGWIPRVAGATSGVITVEWEVSWRSGARSDTLDPLSASTSYTGSADEIVGVGVSNLSS